MSDHIAGIFLGLGFGAIITLIIVFFLDYAYKEMKWKKEVTKKLNELSDKTDDINKKLEEGK
jgi:hypothetical protein